MPASPSFLPDETIRRHRVIPLSAGPRRVEVGVAAEASPDLIREVAFLTGRQVVSVSVAASEVEAFLAARTPEDSAPESFSCIQTDAPQEPPASITPAAPVEVLTGSVVHQVDRLLREAIERGASDLHLEPYETFFRVRYRLDGVLHTVTELALAQKDASSPA